MNKLSTYLPKLKLPVLIVVLALFSNACFPGKQKAKKDKPDKLGLAQGIANYLTPSFKLGLIKSSQTVASLEASKDSDFNFCPTEWLSQRDSDGYYYLGDINLRVRQTGQDSWTSYSSAKKRQPIKSLRTSADSILAEADLANTFPQDFPLQIERYWIKKDKHLELRFKLTNPGNTPIEIGALGIPLIFNNDFNKKDLNQAHAQNVFYDPYIGKDGGYLQVTRLNGDGPVLLVLPLKNSGFEAYRPLLDDPTPRGFTFEGFYEWMIHSKAYTQNEWKKTRPWNKGTSKILAPGKSYQVGLKFILAPSVQKINTTLIHHHQPVAIGVPGYVLPQDVKGQLFLNSPSPVQKITMDPENSIALKKEGNTPGGWLHYQIQGKKWGRVRLTITYKDNSQQVISYKVIKPESETVADNGHFLLTKQWYVNNKDPFHRSPSVITYDYEAKKQITQDSRAWVAGLSDEGGAGSWLNAIMKEFVQPDPKEIAQLETFVNQTLYGGIQYKGGKYKYGVRKSLFYYEPDSMPKGTYSDTINYKTWAAWSSKEAHSTGRSFDYPHVTAAYWVMYRLARNYQGLVTMKNWNWYLTQAFHTAMAMVQQAPYYAQFGQMEGSVFVFLLHDLKAEGFKDMADQLETTMKKRALHWDSLHYPFGSEMPWDSTGQEEIFLWSRYFGFTDKEAITIKAILAYMPTVPSWAYNGNARRYWDFLYGGKLSRIERMIHHYGSAINAIPVLTAYRDHPNDLYLLRVGYGGMMGALANITKDGFAPCAFHSFPSTLKNDALSGDYGCGYYGYAVNSATYITKDSQLGWLCYGGNLSTAKNKIVVSPTTAAKSKIFISPSKTWIELVAGTIKQIEYNPKNQQIKLTLNPGNSFTPRSYLSIQKGGKNVSLNGFATDNRGYTVIPNQNKSVTIQF